MMGYFAYQLVSRISAINSMNEESAGLAGVSSEMGLDDGLLVSTLLLLI